MYSSSASFKAAVSGDHVVISKAEVWASDQKLQEIKVKSGTVSINSSGAIRRTCSLDLFTDRTSTNLVPDNNFDLLTPFGNELRLFRGVQYGNGSQEYVPLGVFVITNVTIKDSNEGVGISLEGVDRSIKVARNKWVEPYQLVNSSLEDSLADLLLDRYDDAVFSFPTTNVSVNQIVLGLENDNDPWRDAVEIAELVGFDLFFDANGVVQLVNFPSLDGSVVSARFEEGNGTQITSLDRTINTQDTYNAVIYTIEGTDVPTPIRVEVYDEDPASPTYRFGIFGEVPKFISSAILSTQAEAIKAATSLLNTYIGAQESVSFQGIVDPSLDVNDVVYIKAIGAKIDRLMIIDSLEIPLEPEASMTAQARTVRLVSSGEQVVVGG